MNPLIKAIIFSLLPISELRGGIPVAVYGGVNIFLAYIVCVLANMAVIPIVFFFLEFIHHRMLWFKWYGKIFDKFLERTRKRIHKKVEKYGYLGLLLFTAIPLPITGAYTATLGAWFFGMNKWKAFGAIACGVVIAGIIISTVVVLGIEALSLFVK